MAGKKVAFIGLGVMGYPMAGHLTAKNFDVTVYNRTAAKARSWTKKYGGKIAKTPALAAHGRDVVCLCVGNDDDVRSVVYGDDGAFAGMKRSAVLVDHTSVSAELARELDAAAKERGLRFVDGPISGGQTGADAGALTIMCGGDASSFKKAKPVMNAYAMAVTLMGPAGAGQLTKMVNQICVAGVVQGLAEALTFANKAGLPGELVVDTISKGAAQSWQMDNRAKILLKDMFDGGFSLQWMRKDAGMVLGEADRRAAPPDGPARPVLQANPGCWRQPLGHLQHDAAPDAELRRAAKLDAGRSRLAYPSQAIRASLEYGPDTHAAFPFHVHIA